MEVRIYLWQPSLARFMQVPDNQSQDVPGGNEETGSRQLIQTLQWAVWSGENVILALERS